MEIIPTPLPDLLVIKPRVFEDSRGYFFESFSKEEFEKHGIHCMFVQDNQSMSQKNVLRGLHFQNPPRAQAKLVRVISGSVLDVAVDIRKKSPAYGKHYSCILSDRNKLMMFIPLGFAHGFLTLEDRTVFAYKCSDLYHRESEEAILWNDTDLKINWNIENPVLSEKDRKAQRFRDFRSLF